MKPRYLVSLLLALVTLRASAQTILVYVEDSADGRAAPDRGAVRAGIYNALFEAGYVFFDPGALVLTNVDWSNGSSETLRDAALDGGADYLLMARSATVTTRRDGGRPRIETQVQVHVLRLIALTPRGVATEVIENSNAGREDTIDLAGLGRETGALVAGVLDRAMMAARGAVR